MADIEQLTDKQRFWLQHIEAAAGSSRSLKMYALEHGLAVSSLYGAKKRLEGQGILGRNPSRVRFVRALAPAVMGPAVGCRVLLVNGTVVELSCEVDAVGAVLAAAGRL